MTGAATSLPTAAATIPVIDDNEANRSLALNTLDDDGYRVVLAKGPGAIFCVKPALLS